VNECIEGHALPGAEAEELHEHAEEKRIDRKMRQPDLFDRRLQMREAGQLRRGEVSAARPLPSGGLERDLIGGREAADRDRDREIEHDHRDQDDDGTFHVRCSIIERLRSAKFSNEK